MPPWRLTIFMLMLTYKLWKQVVNGSGKMSSKKVRLLFDIFRDGVFIAVSYQQEVNKMKRTILMGVFALMMSVAFVSGVMAQQKPVTPAPAAAAPAPTPESKLEKFSGAVEKVDMAKKDILVKINKEEMTFSLGNKAKITEGKKELSLNDLKKGMNVSVEYRKEGNKLVAESINVKS